MGDQDNHSTKKAVPLVNKILMIQLLFFLVPLLLIEFLEILKIARIVFIITWIPLGILALTLLMVLLAKACKMWKFEENYKDLIRSITFYLLLTCWTSGFLVIGLFFDSLRAFGNSLLTSFTVLISIVAGYGAARMIAPGWWRYQPSSKTKIILSLSVLALIPVLIGSFVIVEIVMRNGITFLEGWLFNSNVIFILFNIGVHIITLGPGSLVMTLYFGYIIHKLLERELYEGRIEDAKRVMFRYLAYLLIITFIWWTLLLILFPPLAGGGEGAGGDGGAAGGDGGGVGTSEKRKENESEDEVWAWNRLVERWEKQN